jgi:hypothetical protein
MARMVLSELAEIVQPETGRHRRPQDGVCTMELVAWMSGERHTDHPLSVSPVIAAFTRSFNDALGDVHRQRLGALAPRMIETRGTFGQEWLRTQILWDWMIADAVPAWLSAAGQAELAATVLSERAAALRPATVAMDSYGHAHVRPVDDDQITRAVSGALGVAGITGACLAGGDTADLDRGGRARRHWQAARMLARTAAWEVAESDARARLATASERSTLWRTADRLRDRVFDVIERLIAVTEPPRPADDGGAAVPPVARELSLV